MLRGFLFEAEDSMNLVMKKCYRVDNQGRGSHHDSVFVRGGSILFIVVPPVLRHAPMFDRITHWRKKGGAPPDNLVGGGQAGAILRKAKERRGAGSGQDARGPPMGTMGMQPRGPPPMMPRGPPGQPFHGGGYGRGGMTGMPPRGLPRGMPPPPFQGGGPPRGYFGPQGGPPRGGPGYYGGR